MTQEEFEALLAQLQGYGISPEALASMPMIPNSYVDKKWNQDAGAYVPTEMPYSKPSTRMWHANEMLRQIGVPLPILGESMGLPTVDVNQPFDPAITELPQDPTQTGPETPYLDAMANSQDADEQKIAQGIRDGIGLSTIKSQIGLVQDETKRDALNSLADEAYKEYVGGSSTSSSSSGGTSDGGGAAGGDYRGQQLTPVERMYAEAGIPMPWEEYTGPSTDPATGERIPGTLPDKYLPKDYEQNKAKIQSKGQRFLKSVERFVKQTKQHQDNALTDTERTAASDAVKKALSSLGILGADAPGAPEGWTSSEQNVGGGFLESMGDPGNIADVAGGAASGYDDWHDNMQGSVAPQQYDNPFLDAVQLFTQGGSMSPEQNQLVAQGTGYDPVWAGGSPEAHMQIAQEGQEYAAQNHDESLRRGIAQVATTLGHTPSSDAVSARVALARYLGIPL